MTVLEELYDPCARCHVETLKTEVKEGLCKWCRKRCPHGQLVSPDICKNFH